MAFLKKSNNARTTINKVVGIDSVNTELTVSDASDFPNSGDFLVTIWDNTTYPDPSDDPNQEIVKVTNVVGDIFTIERGQENTVGVLHPNNQAVQMLITAGHFEELEDAVGNNHLQNTDTILLGTSVYTIEELETSSGDEFLLSDPNIYLGQKFQTVSAGNLISIDLGIFRFSFSLPVYDLNLEFYDLDESGFPDNLLGVQTVDKDIFPTSEGTLTSITLDTPLSLDADTGYAIVVKLNELESGNYLWSVPPIVTYDDGYGLEFSEGWSQEGNFSFKVSIDSTTPVTIINNGVLKNDLDVDSLTTIDGRDISEDGLKIDESYDHISDTDNPHQTSLSNLTSKDHSDLDNKNSETDFKHVTDDEKDALDNANSPSSENPFLTQNDSVSSQVESLFAQDLNGDLQPFEDYFGQIGLFELDASFNRIPKTTEETDLFFELDINNDIIPKEN